MKNIKTIILINRPNFIMSGGILKTGSLFITGANRGIGLEFVKQLTQLQQPPKHIFATCRNPDAAEVKQRR